MNRGATAVIATVVAISGALAWRKAVVIGLALLVLAWGLAGRRRLAHQLLLVGAVAAGVLVMHRHPLLALACAAAAAALFPLRDGFPTRPDPTRVRAAAAVIIAMMALMVIEAGWHIAIDRERPGVAGHAVMAGFAAHPASAPTAARITATIVAFGLITALLVVLAAAPAPAPGSPAERERVRALAARPGTDSLAPFATRADRTYVFSPDGDAAIGYRVIFGTALAGGDPVGDPVSGNAAVHEFLAECTRRGWRPAVLGSGEQWVASWRALGMRGLTIGDEAVLFLDSFTLESRRMRNVRQAAQRTRNAGINVHIGQLNDELAVELAPVLKAWLHSGPERGFAMNLDAILTPRSDCLVAVASAGDGSPVAFARFAVCGGGRVLTLDVAPRRRDAPNGVVERLILEVIEYARSHGATEISLNFAGFRSLFESPRRGARAVTAALHAFDRWIELAPLYRFTAKFRPHWRPRHLLLRSWPELGWVALAALRAEFGRQPAGGRVAALDGAVTEPSPAWRTQM